NVDATPRADAIRQVEPGLAQGPRLAGLLFVGGEGIAPGADLGDDDARPGRRIGVGRHGGVVRRVVQGTIRRREPVDAQGLDPVARIGDPLEKGCSEPHAMSPFPWFPYTGRPRLRMSRRALPSCTTPGRSV